MLKRLFIFLCLHPISLFAQTDQERDTLYQIHTELSAIAQLIERAEQSVTDQYIQQFNYSQLRDDINAIKEGINDGINSTRRSPRTLPPIVGHYR